MLLLGVQEFQWMQAWHLAGLQADGHREPQARRAAGSDQPRLLGVREFRPI